MMKICTPVILVRSSLKSATSQETLKQEMSLKDHFQLKTIQLILQSYQPASPYSRNRKKSEEFQ
jgi:hypothetical protein